MGYFSDEETAINIMPIFTNCRLYVISFTAETENTDLPSQLSNNNEAPPTSTAIKTGSAPSTNPQDKYSTDPQYATTYMEISHLNSPGTFQFAHLIYAISNFTFLH